MWTRPTITWSLECESSKPRNTMLAAMKSGFDQNFEDASYKFSIVKNLAIVVCVIMVLGLLLNGCCTYKIMNEYNARNDD